MSVRFIDSVHIRESLQRLQVADNLTVPVDPRTATFPEVIVSVMVGIVLIECFDPGGSCVKRQVDVCESE